MSVMRASGSGRSPIAGRRTCVGSDQLLGSANGGGQTGCFHTGRSSLTFFDSSLSGAFRDLSNSFRFGKPTADGIEAVVEFVGSPYMIRDALIVNPRPGQANSGIRALAYPSDETDWTLEISSDVALRYVAIDAPGWIPSDNFFHLLAATPYSVRLQRCCDQAAPLGKVASVDSLGTATITASA